MYNKAQRRILKEGLLSEKVVKDFLRQEGAKIEESTKEEDLYSDIDCYVNGVPVSIKAEHAGLRYNNIYVELANLLTASNFELGQKELDMPYVEELLQLEDWEPGWFMYGKVEKYIIMQGNEILEYDKEYLHNHMREYGFLRIKPLSANTRAYQGGKYRYRNTICGFWDRDQLVPTSKRYLGE